MNLPRTGATQKGVMNRSPLHPVLALAFFLLVFQALSGTGSCDLYLAFLLDRSGSMWAAMNGTPKTVLMAEAVEEVSRELPADVAMGLRVYPLPPGTEGEPDDPGLRIQVRTETRDLFPEELARLNPRGRAPLPEHLQKALHDFPDTADSKLLILITDGADTDGQSFCDGPPFPVLTDSVQLIIFSMNVQDETEREELNCLSSQFSGKTVHVNPGDSLREKLIVVSRNAYRQETERQTRIQEERRRQEALNSKTRLEITFHNTLDPFFADSLEVVDVLINGQKIPLDPPPVLASGQQAVIFEQALPQGRHHLNLQYRMRRGSDSLTSRVGSLEVLVEEGKTARVVGAPKSALFHWGCSLKSVDP